jgi:hypothetical protein
LLPSSHHLGYMEATERQNYPLVLTLGYTPPKGTLGSIVFAPSDECPATAKLLSLDASLAIPTHVLRFEVYRLRRHTPVRPVRCCCTSVFGSSVLSLWINQGTQWFSGKPPKTQRTRCSLHQSPLMTRHPRSPGSTLVLRLN